MSDISDAKVVAFHDYSNYIACLPVSKHARLPVSTPQTSSDCGFYLFHLRGLSDPRIPIRREHSTESIAMSLVQRVARHLREGRFVSSAESFHNYSLVRAAYLRVYINCFRLCIHCSGTCYALRLGSNGGSNVLSCSVTGYMGLNVGKYDERSCQSSKSLLRSSGPGRTVADASGLGHGYDRAVIHYHYKLP